MPNLRARCEVSSVSGLIVKHYVTETRMKRLERWMKAHPKLTGLVVVIAGAAGAYYGVPAPLQAKGLVLLKSLLGM